MSACEEHLHEQRNVLPCFLKITHIDVCPQFCNLSGEIIIVLDQTLYFLAQLAHLDGIYTNQYDICAYMSDMFDNRELMSAVMSTV